MITGIKHMKSSGVMAVYRRVGWLSAGECRYFVQNIKTGRILEEFGRYTPAIRWARANRHG